MIEFYAKNQDEIFVSRKDDSVLGVIKRNGKGEQVFTSVDGVAIDGNELLVIAVSVLGLPEHGELVQDHVAQGYKIEIKLTDE